jgi:hypothetical protein
MPGFFQKLAARALGTGTQLVKPVVPSVFANDGLIEPAAAPGVAEQTQGSGEQRRVRPLLDPESSTPQTDLPTEPAIARESVRQDASRRPMSLQEAAHAIFAQPDTRPVLVPAEPSPAAAAPSTLPLQRTPQRNGPPAPIGSEAGARRVAETTPTLPPSIRVTIGRVEVKAEFPAPPAAAAPRSTLPPALTLDEYRRQRDRGLR